MQHEYKMEPALRRPGRIRGIRSPNTRLAIGLTEQLNAAAEDGWEYVRTDSFPVEFRSGLFRTKVVEIASFLVFRRPIVEEDPIPHDLGPQMVGPEDSGPPVDYRQPEPSVRPMPPIASRVVPDDDDAFRTTPPVGRS